MKSPFPHTRQVPVPQLGTFMHGLVTVLPQAGVAKEKIPELFASHVAASCVQCALPLGPADLLALAEAAPPQEAGESKLGRLRLGYCARKGCGSNFYEVRLSAQAGVDWETVLGMGAQLSTEPASEAPAPAPAPDPERAMARRRILLRVGAGVALIALLLLVRHWMLGGAIPVVRPGQKFKVDPASVR